MLVLVLGGGVEKEDNCYSNLTEVVFSTDRTVEVVHR